MGARFEQGRPGTERPFPAVLVLYFFFARFFAGPLASQRGFHTLFFAGLQVVGVALYLLDDVFLLHLAFEPAQSVLEGLALLKPNICQARYTPRLVPAGPNSYYKELTSSQEGAVGCAIGLRHSGNFKVHFETERVRIGTKSVLSPEYALNTRSRDRRSGLIDSCCATDVATIYFVIRFISRFRRGRQR